MGYSLHEPNSYTGTLTSYLNIQAALWPFLTGQLHEPFNHEILYKELNNEGLPIVIGASQLVLGSIAIYLLLANALVRVNYNVRRYAKSLLIVGGLIILVIGFSVSGHNIWKGAVLGRINFPRYSMPIFSTILSLYVGMAIEQLYRSTKIKLEVPIFFVAIIILSALLSIMYSPLFSNNLINIDYKWKSLALGIFPFTFALLTTVYVIYISRRKDNLRRNLRGSLLICLLAEPIFFIRYGFEINLEIIRLASVFLLCSAAILWLYSKFKSAIVTISTVLILICILLQFSSRHLQVQYDPLKATTPAYINFLQSRLGSGSKEGRILSTDSVISPVSLGIYGVASLTSFGPQQVKTTAKYIFDFLTDRSINYTTPIMWMGMDVEDRAGGNPSWDDYFKKREFYNLVAVKFLVDGKNGRLSKFQIEGIKKVYSDEKFEIYEDKYALSRVFSVSKSVLVYSSDEAFNKMRSANESIKKIAYVECVGCSKDELINLDMKLSGMNGVGSAMEIDVVKFSHSNIEVSLKSNQDQLLIVSDAYYSGWHAKIDGNPTHLLKINGALRGVFVPKNSKSVSMTYLPYDLILCACISLISLMILITYIVLYKKPIFK